MPSRLRKPTEIKRATCIQELRAILGPEQDAPPQAERQVQVLVAAGVRIYCTLDLEPDAIAKAREYMIAPLYQNNNRFRILATQTLYAMCPQGAGQVEAAVLVEYVEHF